MKKIASLLAVIFLSIVGFAQEPASAIPGQSYGAGVGEGAAIAAAELDKKLVNNKYEGKIKGKVLEVCQEKGCWMKVEKSNGQKLMVKFKDYGFFMPKDIVGKEVVLDGEAVIKEVSVKQLRHYAEDAGKSKEEIESIKEPRRELQFIARGVRVL